MMDGYLLMDLKIIKLGTAGKYVSCNRLNTWPPRRNFISAGSPRQSKVIDWTQTQRGREEAGGEQLYLGSARAIGQQTSHVINLPTSLAYGNFTRDVKSFQNNTMEQEQQRQQQQEQREQRKFMKCRKSKLKLMENNKKCGHGA